MKSCIYCKTSLEESSVIDVCSSCGYQVWGEKMFATIISNMENAKEVGDLYQGSVSSPTSLNAVQQKDKADSLSRLSTSSPVNNNSSLGSLAEEAIKNAEEFSQSNEILEA